MQASMIDLSRISVPGSGFPFPMKCECPTCGREGCSGDCDWSGPPEDSSGDWPSVPQPDDDDDDDNDAPPPDDNDEDDDDDTTSTSTGESYEERVEQAILGVMDGEDD
jgi:hypothetical protein